MVPLEFLWHLKFFGPSCNVVLVGLLLLISFLDIQLLKVVLRWILTSVFSSLRSFGLASGLDFH